MKAKLLISVLLLTLLSVMTVSCDFSGNGGSNNSGYIWSSDLAPVVIKSSSDEDEERKELYEALSLAFYDLLGKHTAVKTDEHVLSEHEIVLGDTSRSISSDAKKILDDKLKTARKEYTDDEEALREVVGYTIYSSGSSVAIVWSYDPVCSVALEAFMTDFMIGKTLSLEKGYSKTVVLNRTELFEELEKQIYDEAWHNLEAGINYEYPERASEIVEAMKKLYTVYTDDMYIWLANLYDPEIGGFYHANSARNTIGFLPDIESTSTALSFITSTGMKSGYWGDYIPDWMKEQVGAFVSSLQESDGYFYHPQWGHDVTTSRLGRDLTSAQALLRACGVSPQYAYPGTAESASADFLADPLGTRSTVKSVSKVIAVNDSSVPERFRSAENWQKYLDDNAEQIKQGKQDFYVFGNTLQSQLSQMATFGKKCGVNFKVMTTDFLTEHQNQETGFWISALNYNATNGFHKISDVYNSAGVEIPNADLAIKSTVAVMQSDLQIVAGVEVYNAWSCFGYIIKNIRNYASGTASERNEKIAAIKDQVYEIAAEAIYASYEKIAPLRKPDGSFSYGLLYSADSIQDAPAAVPNTYEGDVNGNALACTSLVSHIYSALDLSAYSVPIFTDIDYVRFIEELESKSGVIKDELNTERIIYDFEDCSVGDEAPVDFASSERSGELIIVNEGDSSNKVLAYTANGGTNPTMDFPINKLNASPNCAIFEFDVLYESGTGHELLFLGAAGNISQIYTTVNGGNVIVKVKDDPSNILATFRKGVMTRLRFEYFWDEGYLALYVNDGIYPSGITEAVLSGGKHQPVTSVHFGAAKAMTGTTYFDNISLEVNLRSAAESAMPSLKPAESITYDFDDLAVGSTDIYPLSASEGRGGELYIASDSYGNNYLNYVCSDSSTTTNPLIKVMPNPISKSPNFGIIEMDLDFTNGNQLVLNIYNTAGGVTYYNIKLSGSEIIVEDGANGNFKLAKTKAYGFVKLRVVYYWTEGYFAITLGNERTVYTSSIREGKSHLPLRDIDLYSDKNYTGNIGIDNLVFDTDYTENPPAMPEPESIVHDFENGSYDSAFFSINDESGSRAGTVSVKSDANGKYLEYACSDSSTSTNPEMTIYPNQMASNANAVRIAMDLTFVETTNLNLTFYTKSGSINYYTFKPSGDNICIVDYADSSKVLFEILNDETIKLYIDYYPEIGEFTVRVGDSNAEYSTKLLSGKSHGMLTRIGLYADKNYTGLIRLDNIVFDTYYVEDIPTH